jgi:hypothetical protein
VADKVTIVYQYRGVKRSHDIPLKWMKTFRIDGITFAISVGQSYYWDEEQEKWRYHKKLYRPELFVLDVWNQYSYLMGVDRLIPFNDWEHLTTDAGTDMLVKAIKEKKVGKKWLLDVIKEHELTGEGGFL